MATTIQIDPTAVYDEGAVALALDLPLNTLLRARRSGELRFVRRGRRVFITGRHLLAWLTPDPCGAAPVASLSIERKGAR